MLPRTQFFFTGGFQFSKRTRRGQSQQALTLNPNYSTAHMWLGVLKNCAGRLDIALQEFERATALDPLSPTNRHVWAGRGHGVSP
ncbi:MAG: hypothetical protein HY736_21220 [Verrucomicrobia bacterium]|nr:hypothetical protein [Verrucomicrobiota bacterium]